MKNEFTLIKLVANECPIITSGNNVTFDCSDKTMYTGHSLYSGTYQHCIFSLILKTKATPELLIKSSARPHLRKNFTHEFIIHAGEYWAILPGMRGPFGGSNGEKMKFYICE